jgi:DNA-binding protein YbaB
MREGDRGRDPTYRTIKGILAVGAEADPAPPPTGNGGAAAHLHGPSQLFANVIALPTTNVAHWWTYATAARLTAPRSNSGAATRPPRMTTRPGNSSGSADHADPQAVHRAYTSITRANTWVIDGGPVPVEHRSPTSNDWIVMQPQQPPRMQQLADRIAAVRNEMLGAYEQAAGTEHVGEAGGGLVRATVKGTGEVVGLHFDPQLRRRDLAELEDLAVQAIQDAQRTARVLLERVAQPFMSRTT